MARILHSFQEEGWRIGDQIGVVTIHPEVRIAVERRQDPEGNESFRIKMFINVGSQQKTIGIAENEYASIEELMDDLGIDDVDEVWEILE